MHNLEIIKSEKPLPPIHLKRQEEIVKAQLNPESCYRLVLGGQLLPQDVALSTKEVEAGSKCFFFFLPSPSKPKPIHAPKSKIKT